jgi:hypothetical protein
MSGEMKFKYMGIQSEGIEAEQWLLNEFRKKGIMCFQPDAISFENDEYILNEIKHQEIFSPPPFFGHGLPLWQINARIGFWRLTGIKVKLIVKEKGTDKIYWQWLDILEAGKHIDTRGLKPRRIYLIDNFEIY